MCVWSQKSKSTTTTTTTTTTKTQKKAIFHTTIVFVVKRVGTGMKNNDKDCTMRRNIMMPR
jgi:hypothetical protein